MALVWCDKAGNEVRLLDISWTIFHFAEAYIPHTCFNILYLLVLHLLCVIFLQTRVTNCTSGIRHLSQLVVLTKMTGANIVTQMSKEGS